MCQGYISVGEIDSCVPEEGCEKGGERHNYHAIKIGSLQNLTSHDGCICLHDTLP